jgi:hypothetical protein
MSATIDAIWQELTEKDDRTSPAEYPDLVLITKDELAALLTLPEAAPVMEAVAWIVVDQNGFVAVPEEHVEAVRAMFQGDPVEVNGRALKKAARFYASPPIQPAIQMRDGFDHKGTLARVVAILKEFGLPPEGEVDQFDWLRERLSQPQDAPWHHKMAAEYLAATISSDTFATLEEIGSVYPELRGYYARRTGGADLGYIVQFLWSRRQTVPMGGGK